LQECEKIKHGIDIVGVVLVEESVLFQAGKDGVLADTDIVCPLLQGDNFSPGCGLMGSPAHTLPSLPACCNQIGGF
jgi:hypothetical protein